MYKGKYGLLIHADGSPGQQSASYKWQFGFDEYISSTYGVVVARVNTRGSSCQGTSFLFSPYLLLGTISTRDYINTALTFPNLASVNIDSTRVAIWGTGVGGYHSLRSLLKVGNLDGSQAFAGSIFVDPVVDWTKYETFFTEQVMLTPQMNENGYNETNILDYINSTVTLKNSLLIYGTGTNDLWGNNSQALIRILTQSRITFQTMFYTDWFVDDQVHFYKEMTSFLQQLLNL